MNGFKKNDEKFPNSWRLEDYEKYADECNRILENERFDIISKYEEDIKIEE